MKRLILLLTILFYFFSPVTVQAQDFHLALSPSIIQVTIKPGKTITQVFNITNLSSSPITLTAQVLPFTTDNLTGQPQILNTTTTWSSYFSLINTDIRLNQPFSIPAQGKQQLVLHISIPNNLPTQDIYATLLLTSPENTSNSVTSITGGIASNLLLTVTSIDNPHSLSDINQFQPHSSILFKIGQTYILDNLTPVTFTANLKNQGNHLISTHGLFEIGRQDHTIHLQPLLPIYTLAHSQRQLLASPSGQLAFTPSLHHLGAYQAQISLRAPNSSTNTSINLLFLPLKAILAFILVSLLLYTIIKFNPNLTNEPKKPSAKS